MRRDVHAQEIKPSWPIPSEMKWEAVNGYPMAYRDAGRGTPIVLVHGSTFDYRAWNAQFDVFSDVHRVIAVSLRHFFPERWDGVGDDFSIEQHAEDVAALIRKLNLGKVHLVGQSRGGAVVVEVAKSHPEVIRTLVLADASIEMPVPDTAEAKEAAEFTRKGIVALQTNLKGWRPDQGRQGVCRHVWTWHMATIARACEGDASGEPLHGLGGERTPPHLA